MGEDIDIEARADCVIDHHRDSVAVGDFRQRGQIRCSEEGVARHFAENSRDLLPLQKRLEKLQVGCIADRKKLHPGSEFLKDFQGVGVGESKHHGALAGTAGSDCLERGINGCHAAWMQADVFGRRTAPASQTLAEFFFERGIRRCGLA